MKIKQKLILIFLSVALLSGVGGYFSFSTSQKALQKAIGEGAVSLSAEILNKIERNIHNRIQEIQVCATELKLQEIAKESNEEFEKLEDIKSFINQKENEWSSVSKNAVNVFVQQLTNNKLSEELRNKIEFYEKKYGYRVFGEIFFTNRYGVNISQTGKTTDYYQADEQWWQLTKENGLYVKDVEHDESANVYSTDIGIRVDDEDGNFLGVIKAVLNIEEVITLIREAESAAKYRTTHLKLINRNGNLIYSTKQYKFYENLSNEESIRRAISTRDDYLTTEGDERDEGKKLVAWSHSKGYRDYKGLGWILIIEHNTEEIFAPVAKLRNAVLITLLAVTAVTILTGFFISHNISKPIIKFRDVALKIGRGKLDTKIEIESKDEVGELANSFNKMAKHLEETIYNLNREITDRRIAEKALAKLNKDLESTIQQLSQSNKELQEFTYIASHDLSEPTRKINAFGLLLLESLVDILSDDDRENLNFMIEGANKMKQMVEALLTYSQVTAKGVQFEQLDLNEIIEQLRELELKVQLEDTKGTISVPEPLPAVRGDSIQIRQSLQNFISNALKYHKKDILPEVTIRAHKEDNGMVRVEVQDNGIGIKREQYDKVFTMFRRLHSQNEYEGIGIGLPICKRIIERHGGKIGIESIYGQGSTLWFTLPAPGSNHKQNELDLLFANPESNNN